MRHFTAAIALLFIFSSCKDDYENRIQTYKVANEGFDQSNTWINSNNHLLYQSLEEQLKKDETKVQASVWQPKAEEIRRFTDSMVRFIYAVKQDLRNEAGENVVAKNEGWMGKPAVTRHVFESHGRGKELYEKLVSYGKAIVNVDEKLKMKFESDIQLFSKGFDYKVSSVGDFIKKYFDNMPVIGALTLLSRFENNVRLLENQTVTFCTYQIGSVDGDGMVEQYNFLVGQSSTYVKAGELIEITAGMGEFNTRTNPKIIIDNKQVDLKTEPFAIHKIKASKIPGRHSIIIMGEFTTAKGRVLPIYKTLSYTVME